VSFAAITFVLLVNKCFIFVSAYYVMTQSGNFWILIHKKVNVWNIHNCRPRKEANTDVDTGDHDNVRITINSIGSRQAESCYFNVICVIL